MRRNGSTLQLIFLILAPAMAGAQPYEAGPSIHQEALDAHRHLAMPPRTLPPQETLDQARTRLLGRVVYGYYPYWVQDLSAIRWSALTHLAWFSIEMDAAGNLTANHGWPDTDTVTTAHAAAVRVDLTFTLFSGAGIQTLCADPARRSRAIGNMIDAMEAGNADGISVDFEGLSDGTRDDFSTFIRELREALDLRGHPGAEISIAAPAVDWNQQFDIDALLDHADWFFIMGYGYFWSGSSRTGPTGILRTPAEWIPFQTRSMLRTLAAYSALIPAAKRRQIIHGIPYYGREWVTDSDLIGAGVISHVGSVTYAAARQALDSGRERRWASGVENPWFAWQEQGQWHQVWYDDEESLSAKYDLILDQDLGGVGIWALNYDNPHPELWDLLESRFSLEQAPPPAGHRLNPIPIAGPHFEHTADTTAGPGCYFNYYSCDPDLAEYGREWVYEWHLCQAGTILAHVPDEAGVDPDLQLLTDADQDACLARAHTDLEAEVQPGRYLLVVDTYVDNGLELAGPFELIADFIPSAGGEACAEHLVCAAGSCVCAEMGLTDCGSACVDLESDPRHCGRCDEACPDDGACRAGLCQGASDGGADGGLDGGDDGEPPDGGEADGPASGCGCASSGHSSGLAWFAWLSIGAIWQRRRRRVCRRC